VNSAKENINCRCKLLYYIDENELPTVMRARKDDGKNEVIPFMTYREWEKYKRKGGN
ncbi:phage head morphogenesis protein, partial [Staphylococcus aureus]|nr:phage head morphogenesis protein [Staphylococcus aureus]